MKTFHIPAESWGEPWSLTGAEAHHLSRVLRLGPGAVVRCMDGRGRFGEFRVDAVSKHGTQLSALELHEAPEPSPRVVLALAWTKGLRRGWLLEKAVEFAATELWFWQAARSQGEVPDDPKETWEAKLLAGAKQCGNPRLPVVRTLPGGAAELAREAANYPARYLLHEDRKAGTPLSAAQLASEDDVVCVLGPEGGFAPGEAETLMEAGFAPMSLGPGVLRWETAALLALGLFWWRGGRA